jgi:hypothetical protein
LERNEKKNQRKEGVAYGPKTNKLGSNGKRAIK